MFLLSERCESYILLASFKFTKHKHLLGGQAPRRISHTELKQLPNPQEVKIVISYLDQWVKDGSLPFSTLTLAVPAADQVTLSQFLSMTYALHVPFPTTRDGSP